MNEPTTGELNRRLKIYAVKHLPAGSWDHDKERELLWTCWARIEIIGGSVYWDNIQTSDAITHRIFIRTVKGKTRPQDLPKNFECESEDGIVFRTKRVTDCNGAGRFTLLECEVLNASND